MIDPRPARSFRATPVDLALLAALSEATGLGFSALFRLALRELAGRYGIVVGTRTQVSGEEEPRRSGATHR